MTRSGRRIPGLLLVLAIVPAGCGQAVTTTSSATEGLSVDSSVAPVSLSSPSSGAVEALLACGIVNLDPSQPDVRANLGTSIVTGMGLVPRGRDVAKYAAVGPQPDLISSDSPTWIITTSGWIVLPFDTVESKDPTCYVPDGQWTARTWVSTGGTRLNGVEVTPLPFPLPVSRLPALQP